MSSVPLRGRPAAEARPPFLTRRIVGREGGRRAGYRSGPRSAYRECPAAGVGHAVPSLRPEIPKLLTEPAFVGAVDLAPCALQCGWRLREGAVKPVLECGH